MASEDLEIRGAGDLLGRRQSGNIQAIGFEAYARILAEAVAELKGQPILHEGETELAFDVAAFLPDTFVDDTGQRLDFYRRLAQAHAADEVRDVMAELHDRYGELPLEASHYGYLMVCKTYGRTLGATALELAGERFTIRLGETTPLAPEVVLARVRDGSAIRLQGGDRLVAPIPARTGDDATKQLRACEAVLSEVASWVVTRGRT